MRRRNIIGYWLIGIVLLAVFGVWGVNRATVYWGGEEVSAHVDKCTTSTSRTRRGGKRTTTTCTGTWQLADGTKGTGELTGVDDKSAEGTTVTVRATATEAELASPSSLWPLYVAGGVLVIMIIAAAVQLSRRGNAPPQPAAARWTRPPTPSYPAPHPRAQVIHPPAPRRRARAIHLPAPRPRARATRRPATRRRIPAIRPPGPPRRPQDPAIRRVIRPPVRGTHLRAPATPHPARAGGTPVARDTRNIHLMAVIRAGTNPLPGARRPDVEGSFGPRFGAPLANSPATVWTTRGRRLPAPAGTYARGGTRQ